MIDVFCHIPRDGVPHLGQTNDFCIPDGTYQTRLYVFVEDKLIDVAYSGSTGLGNVLQKAAGRKDAPSSYEDVALLDAKQSLHLVHTKIHQPVNHNYWLLLGQ